MKNLLYNSNFIQKEKDIFLLGNILHDDLLTPSSGSNEDRSIIYLQVKPSSNVSYKQEKLAKDFIRHFINFIKKWEEVDDTIFKDIDLISVSDKINEVLGNLILLNPSFLTFDLTEDKSAFFKASINGYNIYMELFFFSGSESPDLETILNIYKEKSNIYAFGGEVWECIEKIKKVVLSNSINVCENELSETSYTQ